MDKLKRFGFSFAIMLLGAYKFYNGNEEQRAFLIRACIAAIIYVPIMLFLIKRFKFHEVLKKIDNRRANRNILISTLVIYSVLAPYLYLKVWDQPPDFPFLSFFVGIWSLCTLVFLLIEIYRMKRDKYL
jgi:hypothetical protein